MSFKWISIDEELPPLREWVLTHSHKKNWQPGVGYRMPLDGNGWMWTDENNTEFDGIQFWARIPALPPLDGQGA